MSFQVQGPIVFTPDPAAWNEFTKSPTGAVGSDLRRRGRTLAFLAARSVQKKSGKLARSINSKYVGGPDPYVIIGSPLDYAQDMHDGTRAHIISPRDQKMLRFKVRGKIVYARRVRHPGTRGTQYLTRHLRKVIND